MHNIGRGAPACKARRCFRPAIDAPPPHTHTHLLLQLLILLLLLLLQTVIQSEKPDADKHNLRGEKKCGCVGGRRSVYGACNIS